MRRNGRGRERDRGASLVEFALIVPLLTLFLFGIVQFGIAYDMKQSINSAAREGARRAAIPATDLEAVVASARGAFQALEDDGGITVAVENSALGYNRIVLAGASAIGESSKPCADPDSSDSVDAEGTTVTVTASVDHVLTIPFFGAPTVTLTGHGEFRCEREI